MNKTIISLVIITSALFGSLCSAQTISGQIEGHDYVDLGLPSGKLWATCNLGATQPTEFGNYFAWGETSQKNNYNADSYKWNTENLLTKYCTDSRFGTVDNKKWLEAEDDAASALWGNHWRTPSMDEQRELIKGCYWKWEADYKGSNTVVRIGTSKKNGNTIILPVAGNREDTGLYYTKSYGYYWSSTLNEYDPKGAYSLDFSEDYIDWDYGLRSIGKSVRAIAK